jgi:sugar (pentulose or hexulose) kinase
MSDVVIGLDLGTSALKGVAVADGGAVIAHETAGYVTVRPGPGRAEQDVSDWESAAGLVLEKLAAQLDTRPAAIGLSGMIPTMVMLDADGVPVGPAYTWEDSRSEDVAHAILSAGDEGDVYRRTGQRLDGRYLVPMAEWVRENDPARFARARMLVGAKDRLFAWLTGEILTDPSTASGFGCYDLASGGWAEDLLTGADGAPAAGGLRFPTVMPGDSTRPLREELASACGWKGATVPVALGAADSVSAALGVGAENPGDVVVVSGTSTVILAVATEAMVDDRGRYLVTPMANPGTWGLEMDLVATGSAIAWLASILGVTADEVSALASSVEPGAEGLAFLPYLGGGEQGALWDPTLRGVLAGLSVDADRTHIARALADGIVLEGRRCLAVFDELGLPRGSVRLTGHAAREGGTDRDLADASGRRVSRARDAGVSASAFGAARLAGASLGLEIPELPLGDPVEPREAMREVWDGLWGRHEQLRDRMFGRRVEHGA